MADFNLRFVIRMDYGEFDMQRASSQQGDSTLRGMKSGPDLAVGGTTPPSGNKHRFPGTPHPRTDECLDGGSCGVKLLPSRGQRTTRTFMGVCGCVVLLLQEENRLEGPVVRRRFGRNSDESAMQGVAESFQIPA